MAARAAGCSGAVALWSRYIRVGDTKNPQLCEFRRAAGPVSSQTRKGVAIRKRLQSRGTYVLEDPVPGSLGFCGADGRLRSRARLPLLVLGAANCPVLRRKSSQRTRRAALQAKG